MVIPGKFGVLKTKLIKMPSLHQIIIYMCTSLLCTHWSVSIGQSASVTVEMQPTTYAEQGTSGFLTCSYSVSDASFSSNYFEWKNNETLLAWVFSGQSPNYPGGAMKYAMSTDSINSSSVLTISSVQFPSDEGRYGCRAQFRKPGVGTIYNETSTMLIVIVVPTSITLSDSAGSDYPTGSTAYLVDGVARQFTCEVPDINPAASFTWSLDGGTITPDNTVNVTGDDKLTTSTSMATLSPTWSHHGQRLRCQASNKDGHAGMSISITLDIKVPPKTSSMSMYDSNEAFTPGGSVSVDQNASHTFTCQAQSRPAANMQWDVGSPSYQESIIGPTNPGPGDGLVDTTSTWTFTPSRTNHRQDVRCVANTTESQQPYPFVMVTLNVSGPPDMPAISSNASATSMTENEPLVLICTADMGYPNDWTLVWSNGGSPITGPSTSSSASGDRYSFTSTLDYTPRRQDNGNIITCVAQRAAWIPGPVGSLGPIDVKYEVNITNKEMDKKGVNNGDTAVLTCIAVGNPQPVMEWYGPNTTGIISDTDEGKFLITNETSGGDGINEFKVTSNLTIKAVDSRVDYGVYTCISSNGIGRMDSLNITLNGTRRPDTPTGVRITERTAESLTVTWRPGYNGGVEQSFHVYYLKTSDMKEVFNEETDGKTTSTATGLDDYTEYEIRVNANNSIGESQKNGSATGYTLPNPPGPDSGITVKYNKQSGTVEVEGLNKGNGCIQLEVQYEGNDAWQKCGACIEFDQKVTLSEWCASSQKRRRRAVGDIVAVQSKYCFGTNGRTCSEPADPEIVIVKPTNAAPLGPNIGLIVGATLGGLVLITIIVVLIVYLVRTSPKKRNSKEDSFSPADDIRDVELQEQSHDAQPEENNGITNEALLNNATYAQVHKDKKATGPLVFRPKKDADVTDTYAQVNKIKLPPKPQSARSAPTNLPDVTYAEVNKDKKPKPPHDDYAAKKKPKKYVPPSSRAAEESAYEEVQISDKDKAKSPPAADSADTYASVGAQQDTSGRVVTEDGLIYAEVGHMKQHPVDQPPIQTEESTEYASLDFARMKPEDK